MEIKKKMKGLTRLEKRKLYGGDKTIMYEKMGLVEESDIEKYRKKLGIKKGIDLTTKDAEEVEAIVEEAANAQMMENGKKKKVNFFTKRNLDFNKEEFKKIVKEY